MVCNITSKALRRRQVRPAKALSLLASAELDPVEKSILQAALTQHQVRRQCRPPERECRRVCLCWS